MIVRKLDELIELVLKGYKPYYHRGVNRWYLRKGNKRVLIDRNLDRVAEEIHKALEDLKKCKEVARRELLRKAIVLRASGLTVNEVIEITGVPRSTLYRYL
jgi:hypothetical protein